MNVKINTHTHTQTCIHTWNKRHSHAHTYMTYNQATWANIQKIKPIGYSDWRTEGAGKEKKSKGPKTQPLLNTTGRSIWMKYTRMWCYCHISHGRSEITSRTWTIILENKALDTDQDKRRVIKMI